MKQYHSLTLRNRLLISFLGIAIPIMVVGGFYSYRFSVRIISELVEESTLSSMERASADIEILLNDVQLMTSAFKDNPFIQKVLRSEFNSNAERYSMDLQSDDELLFISSFKKEIFGLYVICDNRAAFKSTIRSFQNEKMNQSDWYNQVINSNGPVWFTPYTGSMVVESVGESLIAFGLPLIDKATGRRKGVILAELEESMLSDKIGSTPNINTKLVIDYNTGDKALPEEGTMNFNKELPVPGWRLIGITDVSELKKRVSTINMVLFINILVGSLLFTLLAWVISGSIVRPLQELASLMNKAQEGDFTVKAAVNHDNEIGKLSQSFNIMIRKINELMETVNQKHVVLRKTELKALQAQINPHFLYNTLGSIVWLARNNKSEKIIQMVSSLTQLFRIGISRGSDIITLGKELEHIESYLIIQHLRYEDKFSYSIDVQPEMKEYNTLKLVLQPLVENAIYHGVKLVRKKGEIRIRAVFSEENILIHVEDTGPGLDLKKLQSLQNILDNNIENSSESFGLRNVHERLQLFFGPDYGLHIGNMYSSENNKISGFRVTVKLPCIRKETAKSNEP